ncbi:MAG: outer membrane beta-barrel protein [Xanthobacteraceae bacterium]
MRHVSAALIAGVCMGALIQIAAAADLPIKAPVITPIYNWTGFYVGGNAGYAWGNANDAMALGGSWLTDGSGDNLVLNPLGNGQLHPNGFTGGIQVGYNFQTGHWVTGVEADATYFGLKEQFSNTVTNAFSGDPYTFASSFESSWLVTVRPRIGYAFDRLLVYATGGLAITNQKFSQSITQLNVAFTEAGAASATTAGWTVGAGAEYALDKRWSVKAEYLYVDPGAVSFSTTGSCPTVPAIAAACAVYNGAHSADLKVNIVRTGLNYHFD